MTSTLFPIAFFDHALDNVPKQEIVNWANIVDCFGGPVPLTAKAKNSCEAFSLVTYRPGTLRAASNVESVNAIVLDFDHVPKTPFLQLLNTIKSYKLVIYSSYSHSERHIREGTYNGRIILALTDPIPVAKWASVWAYFVSTLPTMVRDGKCVSVCDTQCKDPSRLYFVPGTNDTSAAFNEVIDGHPLNTADLIAHADAMPVAALSTVERIEADRLSVADLNASIRKLSKSKSEELQQAAKWLRLMADGEPWCSTSGQRHGVMLKMTLQLEALHPLVSCRTLARFFMPSLQAMAHDPSMLHERRIEPDEIVKALEGAREKRVQSKAESESLRVEMMGSESDKYTDAELNAICKAQGITREQLPTRWIMQAKGSYYVLTPNGYTTSNVASEMPSEMRALKRTDVKLYDMKPTGLKLRALGDIVHDCGGKVNHVIADMTVPYSFVDDDNRMHESVCQPRKALRPVYHAEVDKWLDLLGGDKKEKLKDWVATCTMTNRVTSALHVSGKKSAGKSLIARGLAAIWRKEGWTELNALVGAFSEDALNCPILVADEYVPEGLTASKLRTLLGVESFSITRKHKPTAQLKGAFRVIFTGNDQDLFKFENEDLSADALDATAPRIFHVEASQEVADYLADHQDWLEKDWIAEHALWLRDNRQVVLGKRWAVEGTADASHKALAMGSNKRRRALEWIAGYALDQKKLADQFPGGAFIDQGMFWVQSNALVKMWQSYTDEGARSDQPTVSQAARMLRGMASERKDRRVKCSNVSNFTRPCSFFLIKPDYVLEFIESEHGYDTAELREQIEASKKVAT